MTIRTTLKLKFTKRAGGERLITICTTKMFRMPFATHRFHTSTVNWLFTARAQAAAHLMIMLLAHWRAGVIEKEAADYVRAAFLEAHPHHTFIYRTRIAIKWKV